jgi:large subunit ribosomal protein L17
MKKQKKGRKFHREKSQRESLLRLVAGSLILKERIKTTEQKAKEARILVEKSITLAKKNDLSSRRRLLRNFPEKLVKKLISEIAPRYEERKGGYTRITKLGPRISDGASIVFFEFVK